MSPRFKCQLSLSKMNPVGREILIGAKFGLRFTFIAWLEQKGVEEYPAFTNSSTLNPIPIDTEYSSKTNITNK